MNCITLSPFKEVVAAIANGKAIIMVDDADRENEGDIVVAADKINQEHISFMLEHARGLICVSLTPERVKEIGLPLQVIQNQSPYQTAFTISVDLNTSQSKGVTATGRAETIKALTSLKTKAADFVQPGNIFPLKAHPSGVLGRRGQTEGSVDISRIAGCAPAGVICEILNPDGSMARGNELMEFSKKWRLPITSVEAIASYRKSIEIFVREVAERNIETLLGSLKVKVFEDSAAEKEHMVMILGTLDSEKPPLVRIHSECLTGDVFGSRRCDCGPQLHQTLDVMKREGGGCVIYLRQEGRGIGLSNKIKAYALQDMGSDTVEANELLGFEPDERNFRIAVHLLKQLGLNKIRLMTNNPIKLETLQQEGIDVVERVPVIVEVDEMTRPYLLAKKQKLGHLI